MVTHLNDNHTPINRANELQTAMEMPMPMLPKSLYEALPYTHLTIGAAIICSYDTALLTLSGCLFFAVGAFMWAMRSDNRRQDQAKRLRDYGSFNRNWYEFKPFFYMLFGLLSVNHLEQSILTLLGMIVGLFGLYLVLQRALHRHLVTPAKVRTKAKAKVVDAPLPVKVSDSGDSN